MNKYFEKIRELWKLEKKLSTNLVFDNRNDIDPNKAKEQYIEYFKNKFKVVNPLIMDYPNIGHNEIVARALQRKKPFRGQDTGGYRDVLIWESILQLLKKEPNEQIVFISNNPKDFADKSNNNKLHPDLLVEVNKISDKGGVKLYNDLGQFIKNDIYPTLDSLNDIEEALGSKSYAGLDLEKFLLNDFIKKIGYKEFNPSNLDFPNEYENPTLVSIDEVKSISEIKVRKITKNNLFISFEAEIECQFDFFMYKSDYYYLPEDQTPEIWDDDWNDHYVLAYKATEIECKIEVVFNQNTKKVESVDISTVY